MTYHIFRLLLSLIVLYHAAAFMAWQYRNPKANQMTIYSHFRDVIAWRKLPEFQ